MITSKNIRTVTDMRKNAADLLHFVSRTRVPVGILKNNKLAAYLIDPETLETFEAFIEDYLDYQLVNERLARAKKTDFKELKAFWKSKNLPQ